MKAMVYRMGGFGDSLLVYPVLEILSKRGYDVTVWGNPEYFNLAKMVGFCKNATMYEPRERFDVEIIFSANSEIFAHRNVSIFIPPLPEERMWAVNYYLKNLNFEGEYFSKQLPLALLQNPSNNLCIVHPGSGSKKKNPEPDFFLALEKILRELNLEVIYILGPAEREILTTYKNSIYLEDSLSIAETLAKASLYIGLDSGVSHLSSYLGVPSIVIFGPSDPLIWHPIGEKLWIIRDEKCPPCFPNVCKTRDCLNTDFLLKEIEKVLFDIPYFKRQK